MLEGYCNIQRRINEAYIKLDAREIEEKGTKKYKGFNLVMRHGEQSKVKC